MRFFATTSTPGGTSIERELTLDRAVLGSSAAAQLRIEGVDEIAPEHAVLVPRVDGCLITPDRAATTPILVEGEPHEGGLVSWGTELAIGRARIRLDDHAKATARGRVSPIMIAAPIVLGVALWLIFSDSGSTELPAAPRAPALFASRAQCHAASAPARYRAEHNEADGSARAQRYPFAPSDGVAAVLAMREAGECYRASGDAAAAHRLTDRADVLARRVELDYRTARFRLERALADEDHPGAIVQTEVLLSLLDGRNDPYVDWLVLVQRHLRMLRSQGGEA